MSKSQAIAAVTAVLAHIIGKSTNGASVELGRPTSPQGAMARKVNIYLYQVTPNAAWRNEDLVTRDSDGTLRKRPQIALDLHYLLSFYGDEANFEPQLMMGAVMRDLNARALLTQSLVKDIKVNAGKQIFKDVITNSKLDESVHSIKLSLASLSLDEMSKVWSVFFQTPYALSVAYHATVVLIETDDEPEEAQPVRDRGVFGVPFARPEIKRILAKEDLNNPEAIIKSEATLLIQGDKLQGEKTTVLIDGVEVTPQVVSDQEIEVKLPPKLTVDSTDIPLRAGPHVLQVMHSMLLGGASSPEPHQIVESSPVAFLLLPTIKGHPVANKAADGPGLFKADVPVSFVPKVGKGQRVWILLKETPVPTNRAQRAYRFMAPKNNGVTGTDDETETIKFAVKGVAQGDYLLEANVDGGESLPVDFKEFV
ncbi:MAG: DUF4255 domain-containing protein [Pyrinomonadaceae bacterium]|nr:DUF4255 domain-containing protein [Pyrinomonadaceae bacterium]